MLEPWNFVLWDTWLDKRFNYADIKIRYSTFKIAIGLFLQRQGGNIVETGTVRQENDWGAGYSTVIFAETLKEFDAGHLWTVDISPENMDTSRRITQNVSEKITYVINDSINYISNIDREIDLLYLDSFDFVDIEPERTLCQEHQLNELKAAFPKLKQSSIILLDDNMPNGGKTKLSKEFLIKEGWSCILDLYQSVWFFDPLRFVESVIF